MNRDRDLGRRNVWRSGPLSVGDERGGFREYRNRDVRDEWDIDWTGRPDADLFWSQGRVYGHDNDFRRLGRAAWGPSEGDQTSWEYFDGRYWELPGPHTGRGPRGYRGSDERITEMVCERLTWHGQIDASDIQVRVEGGEVVLRGMVEDRSMKRLAEDVAETVPGVRDVHNRIRLREQGGRGARFDQREMRGRAEYLSSGASGADIPVDQAVDRFNVAMGATVLSKDEKEIGTVKDIRPRDLRVERRRGRDVVIPFDAVQHATGNRVFLNVASRDVSRQGWEVPGMTGGEEQSGTTTA